MGKRVSKEKFDQSNCNCLWNLSMSSEVDKMGFFTANFLPSRIASHTTLSAPANQIQHKASNHINLFKFIFSQIKKTIGKLVDSIYYLEQMGKRESKKKEGDEEGLFGSDNNPERMCLVPQFPVPFLICLLCLWV